MDDQNHLGNLDICGQQPILAIYTQLCLCYHMPASSPISDQDIIDRLKVGLKRLAVAFPWVAAQVINEGANETSAGTFKFQRLEETPRLIVRDLWADSTAPSWEALQKSQFPFRLLDENIICPRNTIPHGAEGPEKPVFLVQANFIQGGLLLTFTTSHQAMDMTGQGQIMYLLDKACKGEPFTTEELRIGNLERTSLIPYVDGPLPDNPFQDVKDNMPPPAPGNCSWAYLSFPAKALVELKTEAAKSLSTGFVSTDDVVTAFIWKIISRARSSRLGDGVVTTLGRAVDPRRHLNIPETYPGIIVNMVYQKLPVKELVEEPLGETARKLRSSVDPLTSTLGEDTRIMMTKLHRSPLKDSVNVSVAIDGSRDIALSSWGKQASYSLDFGLGLGKPESVRRPQFVPVEGLLYLMPKRLDGEIAVAVCLRKEDLDRLVTDDALLKHGVPIV